MAFPTAINDQITDSISQVNTEVLGTAPAVASSNMIVATSQALGNSAHNAVAAQQASDVTTQASTTSAVTTILGIGTASAGVAAGLIDSSNRP